MNGSQLLHWPALPLTVLCGLAVCACASSTPGAKPAHTTAVRTGQTSTAGPSPAPVATSVPGNWSALHPDTAAAGSCPAGSTPCVTTDPAVRAEGPVNLDANLLAALAADHPELHQPAVTCPATGAYPISCGFSAHHGRVRVRGTLTVLGVEVRTRSYAYSILYRPVA